jgi:hypothetical protein
MPYTPTQRVQMHGLRRDTELIIIHHHVSKVPLIVTRFNLRERTHECEESEWEHFIHDDTHARAPPSCKQTINMHVRATLAQTSGE